jgi:hypothetical protein
MKALSIVLGASIFFSSNVAFGFKNEPDGFRGIKWGTPIAKNASEMTRVAKVHGGHTIYRRKGDKMHIGGAELKSIGYGYYEGNFYSAFIETSELEKKALLAALTSQFGEPEQKNKYIERYQWDGKKTFILFNCGITGCQATISSAEILERIIARQKKDAAGANRDF